MTDSASLANSSTKLYGIFGRPVRHSLSPVLHNAMFRKLGINAVYLAFEVPEGSLGLAFEGMRSMGMAGANVTIPYKEEALQFIDEVPEDVDRGSGAINTVVNRDGRLFGYNTDGPGFLAALADELGFSARGKRVLVLGAGGAARGVLFALGRDGAAEISLHNRTAERAEGLADYAGGYFPETDFRTLGETDLRNLKPDLVVNATPLGMTPPSVYHNSLRESAAKGGQTDGGVKPGDASPVDLKALGGKPVVYDLVYSPAETPLLKQAKSLSLRSTNGLGMLAGQAALSFALWTGKTEGVRETMLEALRRS